MRHAFSLSRASLGLLWLTLGWIAPGLPSATAGIVADPLDAAALNASLERAAGVELVAAFEIRDSDHRLGGLSALLVEGTKLVAVSDRGALWQAGLVFDSSGRLRAIQGWSMHRMPNVAGRSQLDVEGMTRLPDGDLALSLERVQGIVRLDPQGRRVRAFHRLPSPLDQAPANEGPESLTTWPDGRLLVINEGQTISPDRYRGALLGKDAPEMLIYQSRPGFKPSDAARCGGELYVLTRRFSLLGGFAARLSVTEINSIRDRLVQGQYLVLLDKSPLAENYEGLAVTPGVDGGQFIYLISDDNFFPLQRTLLLQFKRHAWQK